jgi:hypothetical protein
MPELLSIHGRCPRCSQVLTVPAGQLERVFRCARCQYRVLGVALMEEARRSPPRLASPLAPVAGPFDEDSDDQHTRMHLPESDEEAETALPAQPIGAAPSSGAQRQPAMALQRFADGQDPDDQQTRLHVAGSFDPPAAVAPRPPPKHPTLLGVPLPPRLSRFGAEPEDPDDQATRMHLGDDPRRSSLPVQSTRGNTTRGMPAAPPPLAPRSAGVPPMAPLQRFEQGGEDADDQRTRLQVPINYEEDAALAARVPMLAPRASAPSDLRSPVAPRMSLPGPDLLDAAVDQRFGAGALVFSRWIEEWMHERRPVLLITLAALSAIIAPVFDVLFGNRRQGATVIAANLALFFLWALGIAWLGKLRNDEDVWSPSVAFTRLGTTAQLAMQDMKAFGALPQPLRWRVVTELAGAVGLCGLALASVLTLSHLIVAWPHGTSLVFLWRLFSGGCIVLSVIAAREANNVPAGLSPAPDVTAPAVAHFPAVLDLSLPLSVPAATATPLHQVLEVLSQWEPREWPNRDSYVAVLERHFLRRMGWARIERERRLTSQRADGTAPLIVDESLLIEVVHGFDGDIAERLASRMRRHAKVWRGRPAVIVVFDASRAELLGGQGTPLLEALHEAYPMLTVRMPSARMSIA